VPVQLSLDMRVQHALEQELIEAKRTYRAQGAGGVVLDVETGEERVRLASGSPVQSVLFPAVGWDRDVYYCSFAGIARLAAG